MELFFSLLEYRAFFYDYMPLRSIKIGVFCLNLPETDILGRGLTSCLHTTMASA